MADPAFLFYPGDWLGGTYTLSRFLKGAYMDILVAQFNSGPLSLEEIKTVLGSDFGQAWPALQKKFQQTSDGLFFNKRLELEKQRRHEYSKSRSLNRKGRKKGKPSLEPPPGPSHDTGESGDSRSRGIILPFNELHSEILGSESWIEQTAIHFRISKAHCTDRLTEFLSELKLKDDYHKPIQEVRSHFIHWYKKQPAKELEAVYVAPAKKKKVVFPNHWDEAFTLTLTAEENEEYIKHLKSLGFHGEYNYKKEKIEFIKPC